MKWLNEPNLPEPRFCVDFGWCAVYLVCGSSHEDCSGFNCGIDMVN